MSSIESSFLKFTLFTDFLLKYVRLSAPVEAKLWKQLLDFVFRMVRDSVAMIKSFGQQLAIPKIKFYVT